MKKIAVFSYRNAFWGDKKGYESLHPGIRVKNILYCLVSEPPYSKAAIMIAADSIEGPHLKQKRCYLVLADNQAAEKFNAAKAGTLTLEVKTLNFIKPTTKNFFSPFHNNRHNMSKFQVVSNFIALSESVKFSSIFPVRGVDLQQVNAEISAKYQETTAEDVYAAYVGAIGVTADQLQGTEDERQNMLNWITFSQGTCIPYLKAAVAQEISDDTAVQAKIIADIQGNGPNDAVAAANDETLREIYLAQFEEAATTETPAEQEVKAATEEPTNETPAAAPVEGIPTVADAAVTDAEVTDEVNLPAQVTPPTDAVVALHEDVEATAQIARGLDTMVQGMALATEALVKHVGNLSVRIKQAVPVVQVSAAAETTSTEGAAE